MDVSHNHLSTLPPSLVWCSRLTVLKASHNKLASLPDKLGHLFTLKEIHLQNNHLPYLPASMLLIDLKELKG
jgi:Leucine-rich repeat (LRR) protein